MDECVWGGVADEVIDSGPGGYHGMAYNGANTVESGRLCRAGYFTDSGINWDDRVKLDDGAANDLMNFTLTAWFKTSKTSTQALISGANKAQNNEWLIYFPNHKTISTYLKGKYNSYSISSIADTQWHHIAWVREDSTEYVYLDGALVDSNTISSTALQISSNGLWLGAEQDSVGGGWSRFQEFEGLIDEVKIFNQALGPADIGELMDITRTCGECEQITPIARWGLDENKGSKAYDSVNDYDGIIHGAKWVEGLNGSALEFDGLKDYLEIKTGEIPAETNITIILWVKTDEADVGVFSVLKDKAGSGGNDRHFYLSGGVASHRVWMGSGWETNKAINDGLWHQWALTVESSVGQRAYIDGTLVGSNSYDHSDFDWHDKVWVGFSNDAKSDYFTGVIDEISLYHQALSAEEIRETYEAYTL